MVVDQPPVDPEPDTGRELLGARLLVDGQGLLPDRGFRLGQRLSGLALRVEGGAVPGASAVWARVTIATGSASLVTNCWASLTCHGAAIKVTH